MGIDAILCKLSPGEDVCVTCKECPKHKQVDLGYFQSSSHYIQCVRLKQQGIHQVVLYDFHGYTVSRAIVKLYRYMAKHPSGPIIENLETTFRYWLNNGCGQYVIFCDQGSEKPVPLQVHGYDDWLYKY